MNIYKIKPKSGEKEFVKTLYDAFTNPELQKFLISCGIKNLVLTGVYTSRCVDSTMRSAFNLGYNVIIPEDLVAMPSQFKAQHDMTLSICKTLFGYVPKSDEIINAWRTLNSTKKK